LAAVATLTYAYADRAVVVGPLATFAEPHSYDLCADHAMKLTPPRGWDLVRLSPEGYVVVEDSDDLLAVVEAVREPGRRTVPVGSPAPGARPAQAPTEMGHVARHAAPSNPQFGRARGHLRVVQGEGGGAS
jgi:hypothetical protein